MTEPVYVTHVTLDGDRWDLIAYRAYGDAWAFEPIVAANPSIPIAPVLIAGLRVLVPVRPRAEVPARLPPWKRPL